MGNKVIVKLLHSLLLVVLLFPGSIAQTSSQSAEVRQIGRSTAGHPIEVYHFGNGPRRVIFVGGIHGGYERNTVELAWQLIEYFNAHPALVPKLITLEIVPVANPDGLVRIVGSMARSAVNKPLAGVDPYAGRFNSNQVDLNRNWSCDWQAVANGPRGEVSAGSAPMSEKETRALADFFAQPEVAGVVFWHSAANGVYAGGCGGEYSPASALASLYAQASGYPHQAAFSAYPITGDVTNWLAARGIPAITIELRQQEDPEYEQNLRGVQALLRFFSQPITHCDSKRVSLFYAKSASC